MSILDSFRLDGKTALVTGANRGLGQGIAVGLAEAGAEIIGLNRSDNDGGTGDKVRATGRNYRHLAVDLLNSSVDDLRELVTGLDRVDILVNNAGIIRRADFGAFSEQDWDDVLQVNLKAVFFLSQFVAEKMKAAGGGKIIHIASMLSYQGGIRVPAYTASKHGIVGLTLAMANELAPHNINVNAIAPGYMETDNTAPLRADEKRNAEILGRIPAGKWGQPADLQGTAVLLASAAGDYMQGAVIPVDGGWLAR